MLVQGPVAVTHPTAAPWAFPPVVWRFFSSILRLPFFAMVRGLLVLLHGTLDEMPADWAMRATTLTLAVATLAAALAVALRLWAP